MTLELLEHTDARVDMGVVGGPDEVVGTEATYALGGHGLVGIGRDDALPIEVLAWELAERRTAGLGRWRALVWWVPALEPGDDPGRTRLEDGALEPRVLLEHPGTHHLRERRHDVDGEEAVPQEAFGRRAPVVRRGPEPLREQVLVVRAHDDVEREWHV